MFQLNPHGLTDAWWQHLLMVFVSLLLGYIIGYRSGYRVLNILEDQVARLGVDIEKCRKSLLVLQAEPISPEPADDLKIIEGIGPKIEKLLNRNGLHTFAHLSIASPEKLRQILNNAGPRFQIHDPGTWPRQALMAKEGKWEELKQWQEELDGGVE